MVQDDDGHWTDAGVVFIHPCSYFCFNLPLSEDVRRGRDPFPSLTKREWVNKEELLRANLADSGQSGRGEGA